MNSLVDVDWNSVFMPHTSLLEIVVRGTVTYLCLFTLLRLVLRRQRGGVGVTDLLVIVLIADAAQNAMAGSYTSLTDGVVLVAVIIGWAALLDWVGFHVPWVQRMISPPPLALYKNGQLNRQHMRSENITEDEIMQQLRLQGMTRLEEAEQILLEGDGQMSVVVKNRRSRRARREVF
jgi:uncharacterized membrane protein YcaP (DUF421 family)